VVFPSFFFFKNNLFYIKKFNFGWLLFWGLAYVFSKFSSKKETLIFDTMLVAVGSSMTAWLCHFDVFQNHSAQILFGIAMQDNNGNGCLPVAGFPLGLLLMG